MECWRNTRLPKETTKQKKLHKKLDQEVENFTSLIHHYCTDHLSSRGWIYNTVIDISQYTVTPSTTLLTHISICWGNSQSHTYLVSNLRRRAINMPGITISPSPSMAKLFAARPFSSKSCGNTTVITKLFYFLITWITKCIIYQKKNITSTH